MAELELNAVVTQRVEVAPDLIIVRVAPDGWELPEFRPGQFAVLGLPGAARRCSGARAERQAPPPDRLIRRSYSIASSSRAREYLEFYITLVPAGALSPRLFGLETGDRVWLGPKVAGRFTLDLAPEGANVLLVATGTGLAPYMSMLRTAPPGNGGRRYAVLLGARNSCGLGYHAELEELQRQSGGLLYLPTISRPQDEPAPWPGVTGYVQELWQQQAVEKSWGVPLTPDNTRVFLCGNPAMIEDMVELLADGGFKEHSRKHPGEVYVESFW